MNDNVPKTMRALVYRGVDDMRVEILPVPRIGSHELLVKVAACGVCPTDIKKIKFGTVTPPRVFGHETAGTVARVGSLVRGFRVGQRVALHHHVPCLKCRACTHRAFAQCPHYKKTGITAGFEPAGGGFSEYVRVMKFVFPGIVRIPRGNTFEEGAMLEPVNTVLKGVMRLGLQTGDRVLVVGQGPIGLLFTRLLSRRGMKVTASDLLNSRLIMAKRFGADVSFNPNSKNKLSHTQVGAFDAAVITIPSNSAVAQAQNWIRGGGRLLLFGHTQGGICSKLDLSAICVNEKDLVGSYSTDFTLQPEVASLVFSRKVDVRSLISHRFTIEEGVRAVRLADQPSKTSLKLFICP